MFYPAKRYIADSVKRPSCLGDVVGNYIGRFDGIYLGE